MHRRRRPRYFQSRYPGSSAGTSLTVYPAAGLIRYYGGSRLVLINRDETQYDSYADLIFRDPIGTVLSQVV